MYELFNNQCVIKNTKQISPSCSVQTLAESNSDENSFVETAPLIHKVASSLRYAWSAKGPRLEVIDVRTGDRIASWMFGNVLRDKKTRITCVTELPDNMFDSLLLVGLECELTGGMICVFNVRGSKVLKAIHIKDKVSSIYVVSTRPTQLPGLLKCFDGVVAVGTISGLVYLIDLCPILWEDCLNPELNPSELITRTPENVTAEELDNLKDDTITQGYHIAVELNDVTQSDFILWSTEGNIALKCPKNSVNVSSLLYVPKLLSLFVGYNFGAWQIYNLVTLELEFTSTIYKDIVPISNFAYQEPSDDPRAYCYVWTIYSQTNVSERQCFPFAAMYALSYESKRNVNEFGVLYQSFTSCSLRFQMDLHPLFGQKHSSQRGGACVALESYVSTTNSLNSENSSNPRLTLCMIVWNTWSDSSFNPNTFMAIFDLDQWYKEQMPSSLRDQGNESFIIHFDITKLLHHSIDSVQDVKLDVSTLSSFSATQRLEEHYYPSALGFDFLCTLNNSFCSIQNYGLQRYLLLTLEQNGVEGFLEPHPLAHQCLEAGLQAISSDITPRNISAIDNLLSIALEHNLIRLLTACARTWATGVYASAGCTLELFVDWATQRAEILQTKANNLCISLFDYSDIPLDCNARRLLNQCTKQIRHLSVIFGVIAKECIDILSEEVLIEINDNYRALQMVSNYFNILQWLLNIGLLPEAPLSTFENLRDSEFIRAPYLSKELDLYYKNRRRELNNMRQVFRQTENAQPCDLLFIDSFIEYECGGEKLRREWCRDVDDSSDVGFYPPKSLQTLLRTYLVDGIDIMHKHTLLLYLFLDLAALLKKTRYSSIVTYLIKFPSVFQIPTSTLKITQAFWQIDHGNFSSAMELLLDPLIKGSDFAEFRPWQHKLIFNVLHLYEQNNYAVLYLNTRHPPMVTAEEITKGIQVLLANNMMHAAFEFQRKRRSHIQYEQILTFFFEESLKQRTTALAVLKLSLNEDEEAALLNVLKSRGKFGTNLLFSYYIQRNRGFEALHTLSKENENDPVLRIPNMLMKSYMNAIPKFSKSVFAYCQNNGIWTEAPKPQTKTVIVQPVDNKINYKSNIIAESISKVRELWQNPIETRPFIKQAKDIEQIPFICTPKKLLNTKKDQTMESIPYETLTNNIKKRSITEGELNQVSSKRRRMEPPENPIAVEKLILTPIVKRSFKTSNISMFTSTPQSILKLRKKNRKPEPVQQNLNEKEMMDVNESVESQSNQKSQLSKVHFVEAQKNYSSEGSEILENKETPEELSPASTVEHLSDLEENRYSQEDKQDLDVQEIDTITKKLRSNQSKTIQKRKSLQQSVLEQAFAKNVAPVLNQSARQSQILDASSSKLSLSQRISLDSSWTENFSISEDILQKYGLTREDVQSIPKKNRRVSVKGKDLDSSSFVDEEIDNSDFISESILKKFGLYQSSNSENITDLEDEPNVSSEISEEEPNVVKNFSELHYDTSSFVDDESDTSENEQGLAFLVKKAKGNVDISGKEEISKPKNVENLNTNKVSEEETENDVEIDATSSFIDEDSDLSDSKIKQGLENFVKMAKKNVTETCEIPAIKLSTSPKPESEVDIYENLDLTEENEDMNFDFPTDVGEKSDSSETPPEEKQSKEDSSSSQLNSDEERKSLNECNDGSNRNDPISEDEMEHLVYNDNSKHSHISDLAEKNSQFNENSDEIISYEPQQVDFAAEIQPVQQNVGVDMELPLQIFASEEVESTSVQPQETLTSNRQLGSTESLDRHFKKLDENKQEDIPSKSELLSPKSVEDIEIPRTHKRAVSEEPRPSLLSRISSFISSPRSPQIKEKISETKPIEISETKSIEIPKLVLNDSCLISEDESDLSAVSPTKQEIKEDVVKKIENIKEQEKEETNVSEEKVNIGKSETTTEEPPSKEPPSDEMIKPSRRPRKAASVTASQTAPCKVYRTRSLDQSFDKASHPTPVVPVEKITSKAPPKAQGRKSVTLDKKTDISTIEEYSSARRLTRRQKSLMSQSITSLGNQTLQSIQESDSDESAMERGPDLEPIDPIQLLDKSHFIGTPDPEEQKFLDHSPTSTIKTASSIISESTSSRIRTRSQTNVDTSPVTTPVRRRSQNKSTEERPESTRVTRRSSISSKKSDDEESVVSSRASQVLTPKGTPKRVSKTKQEDTEEKKSSPPKRDRSRSVEKEPKGAKRKRESIVKTQLSPIREIEVETASTKTANSRSKRSTLSEQTSSQPVRKSSRLSNRSVSSEMN